MASRRWAYVLTLALGATAGVGATQAIFFWFGSPFGIAWEPVDLNFMFPYDAIAGALLANLGWVFARPRERMRRSSAIAMGANALVWFAFLLVVPPLTPAEFDAVARERAQRDASTGGLDLITHEPIIVAARMHYTYGSETVPDRFLGLFAGPAIDAAALLIVPIKYGGARATRSESFTIAAAAFVFSTAFWAAVPSLVGTTMRIVRRIGGVSHRVHSPRAHRLQRAPWRRQDDDRA
jgi:hypothetical protein